MTQNNSNEPEIIIINETDSPFKKQSRRDTFKQEAVRVFSKGVKKVATGAWVVGQKAWRSEARKKTTDVLGQQLNKAWKSDTRKNITRKMGEQAGKVIEKNRDSIQQAVTKAVNERLDQEKERLVQNAKETDWQTAAKQGSAKGLKGLSQLLKQVAQRIDRSQK